MRVSVVIPSFDRPDSTARALTSVVKQTFSVSEIVIVDDGSSPPLALPDWARKDERIRLVNLGQNSGPAVARQAGVDASSGDFIAFLDSDDVWLPEKLEHQVPLLRGREHDLLAVACGWETVPENGGAAKRRIPVPGAGALDFASGCWFSPGSTAILPRSAFAKVGPFSALRRLEDLDWFARFGQLGGRLEVAPIVGARISTGRRATIDQVERACNDIASRLSSSLDPRARRRLNAYLYLERAAAARNEQRMVRMLRMATASICLQPRARIALRRWWDETDGG